MDTKSRWCLLIILFSAFLCAFSDEDKFVSCHWGLVKINCTSLEQDKEHVEVFNENNFYRDEYRGCMPSDLRTYGKNTEVKFLNCRFPTVPHDLFQRLQTTNEIILSRSGISTIGDARFPDTNSLTRLSMSHNNLTELPNSLFSNTLRLKEINFSFNQIRKIDPKTFEETKELDRINFSHNLIEAIDEKTFVSLTNLFEIDFSYNQLETFHIESLKSERLWRLVLSNNKIAELDCILFDSPKAYMREIDVSMNQLREIDLSCDKSNKSLFLDISDNLMESLTLPASDNLDALIASGNKIKNIFIESELKQLKRLRLDNNSLSDFSGILKHCTSLTMLSLSFNDIHDVGAISIPDNLSFLNLTGNRIAELECNIFPNNEYYTIVEATLNQITEIDLNCNKVSGRPILAVGNNLLESLTLPASTLVNNMQKLVASSNNVRKISVENELKNLTELYLGNNSFSDVSDLSDVFEHCTSLLILDLSFNNMRKLGANSLIKMTELEILHLSHINLSYIDYGTFSYSKKLRILDLSHNKLKHFYFEWLLPAHADLEELYLNDNNITQFFGSPKDVAPRLNELKFSNNNLDCAHLSRFVEEISAARIKLPSETAIKSHKDARSHVAGIPCANYIDEQHKGEIVEAIFENSQENKGDLLVKLILKLKEGSLQPKSTSAPVN